MQAVMWCFILYFVCWNAVSFTEAQTGTNAKALRTKLFVTDNYDRKVRSANDQANPTDVEVNLFLVAIHELDEVTETLKTTGYLEIIWKDDFLQWTPADYGGIQQAFFPQDDVWKPDVALKNSMTDYKQLGVSTLNVAVIYDGTVSWYPFQVFQSSCSVSIKYFPFDTQTCKLKFVAWSYTKDEVNMRSSTKGIVLDDFEPSSEWDIVSTSSSVEEESGEPLISFTLTIRRKPRYMFLSIIFPIIMLTILNIFVFVLPSDSGEKASYSITVFLAFAVFLTIVASSLPENSDSTALFSIYILIQTTQSTLITMIALVLIRLYNIQDERPIPNWLIWFVKLISCKRRKGISTVEPETQEINGEIPHLTGKLNASAIHLGEATDHEPEYDWKRTVNTLDWFFLISFTVLAFLSTFLCFLLSYTLSETPA